MAMDTPGLWDDLRAQGINADDAEVRTAVRTCLESLDGIRERSGEHAARRCLVAVHAALDHAMRHPSIGDMTSFEDEFDDPNG